MQRFDGFAVPRQIGEENVLIGIDQNAFLFGFAIDDVVHPLSIELILLDVRSNNGFVLFVGLCDQRQLFLRILLDMCGCRRIDRREFNV